MKQKKYIFFLTKKKHNNYLTAQFDHHTKKVFLNQIYIQLIQVPKYYYRSLDLYIFTSKQ